MDETNSFDRLVMGLTNTERIELLRKMESISDPESQNISAKKGSIAIEGEKNLSIRIKQESFFLRLWLKIKSIFTSTSVDFLYNKYLVDSVAREVQNEFPDLIDTKRQLLMPSFYEGLKLLKKASDFFKSSISVYEDDAGAFYVFLAEIYLPDLSEDMKNKVSPYQLPFDREVTSELRTSLIRRMDEILQTISSAEKNKMYISIQSLEWLKQFTHLPFEHLFSKFTSVSDVNYCARFDAVDQEIEIFARVLCNGKKITTEILEALFLFSSQSQLDSKSDSDKISNSQDDSSENATKSSKMSDEQIQGACSLYEKNAITQLSIIKNFINSVPMDKIAMVTKNLSIWEPGNIEGAEDWFVKFKAQWKKIFDQEWESWLNDKKKFQTKEKLQTIFGTNDFPLIENRPWKDLWGGVEFSKEYTLGYLYAFFKQLYPIYSKTLKIIMAEGEFSSRDNQNEFTDTYNSLNHIEQSVNALNEQLSPKGSFGISFQNMINGSLHTIQEYSKVTSLLSSIENQVRNLASQFIASAKTMHIILNGILTPSKTSKYDALSNLNQIQGNDNNHFKLALTETKNGFANAEDMIKEIDAMSVKTIREM